MGQGGQPLGDRPETVESQGIHRKTAESGKDPNAIALAIGIPEKSSKEPLKNPIEWFQVSM
jgi:hypothetical protein